MQHRNLLVFDIETVPDDEAAFNLTGFDEPDTAARRAEIERYHLEITGGKNAFPRQPFHRVVAISFLRAEIHREDGGEAYFLQELRTGGTEKSGEKELVAGFFQFFERHKPRLVSFNGRTFDLPVLKYRAMKYGLSAEFLHSAGDKWNSYTSRYSADWHCDLLEVLSDYGASARIKLNEVCAILGFPGKFGTEGSQVAEMFDAGRVGEIRDYCETDVLNTYLVYLRHRLHTGGLSTEGYNRAVADVISLIESDGAERPHLTAFLEAWGGASGNTFML